MAGDDSAGAEKETALTNRLGAIKAASDLRRETQDTRSKLEELERLGKIQQAKEIEERIRRGELPSIAILPLPEDDFTIAKIPTLFTRIPIFKPTRNRSAISTDWEKGEFIRTAWGSVTRFGPGLTLYDEGTLIGLYRTCWRLMQTGPRIAHRGLEVVKDPADLEKLDMKRLSAALETIKSVSGTATYYQINKSLGRDTSGKELRATKESIERLAKTVLKIYKADGDVFGIVHFFYVVGDECSDGYMSEKAGVTVTFPPGMVEMMNVYTLIDLTIWHNLGDLGKATYKFLCSQLTGGRTHYEIGLEKLVEITGYNANAIGDFKRTLTETCDRLVKLRWASQAVIAGTGRGTPFKLVIDKAPR